MPGGFLGCQEGGRGGKLGNFSPIQGAEGLEGGAELAVAEGGAEPLLEETLQAQDGLHVRLVLGGEIKGLKGGVELFGTPPGGRRGSPHLRQAVELADHAPDVAGELLGVAVARGELPLQLSADQGQVDGVAALLKKGGGGGRNPPGRWIPSGWIPSSGSPRGAGLTRELERRWRGRQGSWQSSWSRTYSHFCRGGKKRSKGSLLIPFAVLDPSDPAAEIPTR